MKRHILSLIALFAIFLGAVAWAAGPFVSWERDGIYSPLAGVRTLLWHATVAGWEPGSNNSRNLGSSTNTVAATYSNDMVVSSQLVTANTTLTSSSPDRVNIGLLSGNITIKLPAPTGLANRVFNFQDTASTLGVNGNVTVQPLSGTINGATNVVLSTTNGGFTALCVNGTKYSGR